MTATDPLRLSLDVVLMALHAGPWNAVLKPGPYRLLIRLLHHAAGRRWRLSPTLANATLANWLACEPRQALRVRDQLAATKLIDVTTGTWKTEGRDAQAATIEINLAAIMDISDHDNVVTSDHDTGPNNGIVVTSDHDTGQERSHKCPHMGSGRNERTNAARARLVRPRGTLTRAADSFAYTAEVRDRANVLAAWAAGPGVKIINGGSSAAWLDLVQEFIRLDIPDDAIQNEMRRRVAIHYEDTGESVHSLAYFATPLSQWAQRFDKAATAPVARVSRASKPTAARGFVQEGDEEDEAAAAAQWRKRGAE